MSIGAIAAFLLLLVVVFGNLWFNFIEAMLQRIKRVFTQQKEPPAWHPLPQEKDQ